MIAGRLRAMLFLCLAGLASLRAQDYTHVSGLVLDASYSSVPGALITVVNEHTGFRRITESQSDGGYVVSSLQPGIYKITVRKGGFRTVIRFGVKLGPSQPARADFNLAVGSIQESVTVEGTPLLLIADGPSVGTQVGREEMERLPLNGRGLLGVIELAPGAVITPATRGEAGQFSVGGQRPNANYFTVDGISANSGVSGGGLPAQSTGGALPGMTAFGSLENLVSRDALEEVRLQTSSTVPEFGRLPGAQVSLSSRSGSNELHGALSYGFRNKALDANDWYANQHGDARAPLRLHDVGATLGGPLRRNRTFFFVSYEALRLYQPFVWRQPVPSPASRESSPAWVQPVLKLFPSANGGLLGKGLAEWTGRISRPSRLDAGSLRLDHSIASRLTLFGRYADTPSATEFGSNVVNLLDLRSRGITAGLNLRLAPNLIVDWRWNASSATGDSLWRPPDPRAGPACFQFPGFSGDCDSLVRLSIAGAGQVVSGSEGRRSQSQFQINQTVVWNPRAHSFHFGADYVRLEPLRHDATGAVSVITDSLADLDGNNLWTANSPPRRTSAVVTALSLFAEDTWRASQRLTATLGVRWEISPAPEPSGPANFLNPVKNASSPLERPIWRSSYANFAPRAGLAYRLGRQGRTVLRGGAGLYLDSSLNLATDLVNDGPLNVSQYGSARNAPFSTILRFGFRPDLRLPIVKQWNVTLEHGFDDHNVLSAAYAGSIGRDLIRREMGGEGSTETDWLALATNHGASDYHGLQVHYRRRLTSYFEALVSYAWSHSIDNSSTDSGLYWAGSGLTPERDRGSSDFDVRQTFTAGFTYQVPRAARSAWWRGWALDGVVHARTGFPLTVMNAEQYNGIAFENILRPDHVFGQPNWYADASAPGGRRLNTISFHSARAGQQGNLGRNALTGLGMSQMDLSLRREFFSSERASIQLRIEAFNALNHANFADPVRFLSSPLFGQANSMLNLMLGTGSPGSGLAPLFQSGGPRSLQISVRIRF
jgi:hypothetical protein